MAALIRTAWTGARNAARTGAAGLVARWLVALAIRLPYLWVAPATPDELRETERALVTSPAAAWLVPDPATPYVGAVHDAILSAAFGLLGPSPHLPRLVTAALAAATVPLIYVLARELARPVGRRRLEDEFVGPRLAGLVAAGLVATSAAHVVIASHAALAQNLAPLLVMAALFGLERALGARDGRWLVPSGALLGLALQTHLSVAALLPGAAVALWWTGRGLVLSRWGPAGLAALLLAYANVLAVMLTGGPMPPESAGALTPSQDQAPRSPLGAYGAALVAELLTLWRLLASRLDAHPISEDVLLDALVWPYVGLALLGLAILALRGRPLLPLAALSFLLGLPVFESSAGLFVGGRALMPIVVIGLTAVGVAVGTFAPLVTRRGSLTRLAVAAALLVLVLAPLGELHRYYAGISPSPGFAPTQSSAARRGHSTPRSTPPGWG